MQWKEPVSDSKYEWTEHSKYKMRQYGLSAQRVLRVVRSPRRIETGIVEKTIAVMQPTSMKTDKEGKRTWGQEIWVMYQLYNMKKSKDVLKSKSSNLKAKTYNIKNDAWEKLESKLDLKKKIRIISAWKYPGVSSENDPIPAEIIREISEII